MRTHRMVGRALLGLAQLATASGLTLILLPATTASADTVSPTAAQARASQWWLDGLGVSKAHQVTRGEGVTVCVVDAFFDTSHPDFVGADVSVGADLTHATLSDFVGDPQKDHGTAMAALIVGQGSGPGGLEGVACQRDGTTSLSRAWDRLGVSVSMLGVVRLVKGDVLTLPV